MAAPGTTVDVAQSPSSSSRPANPAALIAIVATVLAMLPAFFVIAKFAGRDVLLTGDLAVIDARVRDVFSSAIPLVGPYSLGWSHPGPMYFYALAPLHAMTGNAAWSIVVTGALLQCVAVALCARLAWRRGGLGLTLLILAVLTLTTVGATARLLIDPWNPHVVVPFFVLFVLQIWSVMVGDRWQALGAAIVGTFLVQTHIGYAPLVAAGALVAVVGVLVDARGPHRERAADWAKWRTPLLVTIAATLVLWIPPLVDQLTNSPGNLRLIARYFRNTPEPVLGLREGPGLFAAQYRPLPPWLGGDERFRPLTVQPAPASRGWLVIPLALLVIAFVVAVRRHLRPALRLVVLVATLVVVGLFALSRVKQVSLTYMSLWRIPLAILVVAVCAWTLRLAAGSLHRAVRVGGIAVLLLVIVAGVVHLMGDIVDNDHVAVFNDDVEAVLSRVSDSDAAGAPFIVRGVGFQQRGLANALINDLDRDGRAVRVDREPAAPWGKSRSATTSEVDDVWLVAEDGIRVSQLLGAPNARVLARTTPLTRTEERELVQLQQSVAQQLIEAGRPDLVQYLEYATFVPLLNDEVPGLDPATLQRIAELDKKAAASTGCRCAVIAFSSDELPGALAQP